jgi:hypothetical protein
MKRFSDFRKRVDEAEPIQQQPATQQQPQAPAAKPAPAPEQAPAPEPAPAQEAPQEEHKSLRESLADKIKAQKDVAVGIIDGIHSAFQDSCAHTTKYNAMGDQIKNFEKQIRGACEQVIAMVEQEKFDWRNWDNCSPKSYNVITKYKERDLDVLKLSAAVIIFYNSLIGEN